MTSPMGLSWKAVRFAMHRPYPDCVSSSAIATLYLTAQGTKVVAQGKCCFVDSHWFRGKSYLAHWLGMG
ncbi:MAG: hypothetical protein AB4426_26775 [Xenococcaceae cyanobacterium]